MHNFAWQYNPQAAQAFKKHRSSEGKDQGVDQVTKFSSAGSKQTFYLYNDMHGSILYWHDCNQPIRISTQLWALSSDSLPSANTHILSEVHTWRVSLLRPKVDLRPAHMRCITDTVPVLRDRCCEQSKGCAHNCTHQVRTCEETFCTFIVSGTKRNCNISSS